jgi:hypothetical protein
MLCDSPILLLFAQDIRYEAAFSNFVGPIIQGILVAMAEAEYLYQNRIVAFIDILGYKEILEEFERDAQEKDTEQGTRILTSTKVNEFLNTFKSVTATLDEKNIRYYLFSDNICITADYIENPRLAIEILFTISDLFFAFAKKGYFLRGAVEMGKFIDEPMIALGNPLTKAYLAESKVANYPRILLSKEYYDFVSNFLVNEGASIYDENIKEHLVYSSCELYYLNVFYYVFQTPDKVAFFTSFREKILENLQKTSRKESLYVKYEWLANLFNKFLLKYSSELVYTEEEEQEEAMIVALSDLKIEKDAI